MITTSRHSIIAFSRPAFAALEMAVVLGALSGSGCAASGQAEASANAPTESAASSASNSSRVPSEKKSAALVVPVPTPEETAPFKLEPDWTGPCAKADKVDVNLGHTPESFIRAAACQITEGKPFIYFYNAGKLEPRDKSGAVLTKMKAMIKADFGVEPFLAVDSTFFDDKSMGQVADQKFQWFTFQTPNKRSRSTMNGVTLDHAMVKWDAIGRDHPGITAKSRDMFVKDTSVLDKVLSDSADADLLILATGTTSAKAPALIATTITTTRASGCARTTSSKRFASRR